MFRKRTSFETAELLLACFLVLCPTSMTAQHHGGHGVAGGVGGAGNRPTGVDEKDPLKDFHRAMAVEATSQQASQFQALVKETDTAKSSLRTFVESQQKLRAGSETGIRRTEIDPLLERLRADNQKFVDGFSAVQKSGLKENLKKLAKADSDLQASQQKLDATSEAGNGGTEFQARGERVITALTEFSDQQLAMGNEMGILLAQGSDLTFTLPEVRTRVTLGSRLPRFRFPASFLRSPPRVPNAGSNSGWLWISPISRRGRLKSYVHSWTRPVPAVRGLPFAKPR